MNKSNKKVPDPNQFQKQERNNSSTSDQAGGSAIKNNERNSHINKESNQDKK